MLVKLSLGIKYYLKYTMTITSNIQLINYKTKKKIDRKKRKLKQVGSNSVIIVFFCGLTSNTFLTARLTFDEFLGKIKKKKVTITKYD